MPFTAQIPKVMLPVGDRPVLGHNLLLLKKAGIEEAVITLYHKAEAVRAYFREGSASGVRIRYCQLDTLRGSAGDLKRALDHSPSAFLVMYADNFSNCDLARVCAAHKPDGRAATVVVFDRTKNANSGITGGCVRMDEVGRITEFIEGQGNVTPFVNAGIYVLEPKVLDYIPADTFMDFGRDLFPLLLARGEGIAAYVMPSDEFLFGIDTIECYETTKNFYKAQPAPGG